MLKLVVEVLPAVLLTGCKSADGKRKVVAEKSVAACYAMGYNQGADAFRKCSAGAGLVYTDQIKRELRAKGEAFGDALASAGSAIQTTYNRPKHNCTSARGIGGSIETSCY